MSRSRFLRELWAYTRIQGLLLIIAFLVVIFGVPIFPPDIGRDEALIILQSMIQLNGFLVGFAGLMGTLLAPLRPNDTKRHVSNIAGDLLACLTLFLVSILACIYDLSFLKVGMSLTQIGLFYALIPMFAGVVWIFVMVGKAVRPSNGRRLVSESA